MIQMNLLPDVKLAFLKAERQKRIVMFVSTIVIIASLTLLAFLLLSVKVVQQKSLSDLEKDIDSVAAELQSVQDLDKILTVQSQLGSLAGLHENKVTSSRLFDIITQVTPAEASISSVKVDYEAYTIEVMGKVDSLRSVNKYADSFKFTTYTLEDGDEPAAAFANVVLSSFSRQNEEAEYTLTMNYDPQLFINTIQPKLSVPNIMSTRADVERPTALFQPSLSEEQMGAQ